MTAVVIGVGNEFRRDDGVGPAVARAPAASGVRAEISDGDPVRLMEAWEGAEVVVIVDAVRCTPALPGRWHRTTLPHTVPAAVEVTDVDFGTSLSPAVAAAVAPLAAAILTELTTKVPDLPNFAATPSFPVP
ncbi:hydrogenase maturation protease [Lentzea sp. BCCO 10_0856]|uniref:Hydrogenase maturation protease n=1 Tax=Lentzea miocenica TaxID=3095431 RepID=A0ABU4T9V2_9PSEU|nr:hydrogenase maturation protease [Lentzea sp. BCCO 10_0856]MDX8034939.1 hydrogenase maturation protease [Lentzea sp. BCCO 10_0856]